jgi:hypothetical protein
MFRKLKQGLQGKGSKAKFRLDVAVERVEGLPPGVAACRLQWTRGAKVAVTKLVPASNGEGPDARLHHARCLACLVLPPRCECHSLPKTHCCRC